MSIYRRRSGKYAVLVELAPTNTGLRRRRSLGTFRTRKDAERAERHALESRDRGFEISPQTVSVRDLIERYIARCRTASRSTTTIERYEAIAKNHIIGVIGTVPLSRLTPEHVNEVHNHCKAKGLSGKSIRHAHALLHAALAWAVEKNLCARNVANVARRDLPKAQRSPARALTEVEARRLLAACADTPWHAVFTLALCTGVRRAELVALKWSALDLERSTVTIAESIVRTKSGTELKGTKTGAIRTVSLSSLAITALRLHRVRQNEQRLRLGALCEWTGFIFTDGVGQPWNPGSVSNAFRRFARQAQIPTTRMHDLRHSAATWLLQGGVDIRTVAAVLGHSNASTTLVTYAHVLPGAEAKAVEAIADRLAHLKTEAV